MKKTFFLLMVVVAFGMMSCDTKPAQVNPSDTETVASLKGCDMAVFEDGKVTFYNSSTNTFVPFTDEKDFVLSGVFFDESDFYYTVSVDDELYLRKIDLSAEKPAPVELTDWELKLSDCHVDSCGSDAWMYSYSDLPVISIEYNMGEMCSGFRDARFYLFDEQTKCDGWPESIDASILATEQLTDHEHFLALPKEEGNDETCFYYIPGGIGSYGSEEEMAANRVCISDKINFHEGRYSGWEYEPEFEILGISPEADCAVYAAIMEWGRGGHGPLCFATVDGKVQKLLAYDANYGWLGDNRLVFSDDEGIKTVTPDGTITKLTSGERFVTAY